MCENVSMYLVAILGDLFSLLPFVNFFSTPITGFLLWVLGSEENGKIYGGGATGLTLLTYAVELGPLIAGLPMWTGRVFLAKREAKQKREASQGGKVS